MTGLLLLSLPAWGQDLRAWQGMHEGMLAEVMDGDLEQSIDWYAGLSKALPKDDPTHQSLRYWEARANYSIGDQESSRKILNELIETKQKNRRAEILLGRIRAYEQRIQALPIHHSFLDSTEHWVHGWKNPGKGSLGLATPNGGGDRTLAWSTRVEEGEEDAIALFFDTNASKPSIFRLSIRSDEISGWVLPTLEDIYGSRFTIAQPISLHRGDWVALDLRIPDFQPTKANPNRRKPGPIRSFELRDVTAFYSSDRGLNTLYLGDVVLE